MRFLVSPNSLRLGTHFCLPSASLLQALGPSVRWRPAHWALSVCRFLVALGVVWAARLPSTGFALASAGAARPAASGSAAGDRLHSLGALRVAASAATLRAAVFASTLRAAFFDSQLRQVRSFSRRGCGASGHFASGLPRFGIGLHNRAPLGGANPSFNRTCNGVPAQAFISFSACFVTLSQAG